ncbi:alpha/beta hydrolase [Pseudonocardia kujensis]|uniref:alpha/beta fold hydrolase n=1 Tax=Pseudonocardia kujensis TaxID=1128675 RepID=UPI001E571B75|nr:alpha/beta fold hydrolase [Pseudonocardia kujensis]MCE0765332.1 alpha/beta hydrolase [Pseudonocardia kujensis]
MVLVRRGVVDVDVDRVGAGPPVVLLGSIAGGRRVWDPVADALLDRYRVLTLDLHGHGATPPWPGDRPQTLSDQVRLVHAVTAGSSERLGLVGHSFGGAVAMRAAVELGERVRALVLVEPTPFALLARAGRDDLFDAVCASRDRLRAELAAGRPDEAAREFTDHWLGPGVWDGLSAERRAAVLEGLRPRLAEFDAMTDPGLTLAEVATADTPTLLIHSRDPSEPVRALVDVLAEARPDWECVTLPGAGRWAPLTGAEELAPAIGAFLDRHLGR